MYIYPFCLIGNRETDKIAIARPFLLSFNRDGFAYLRMECIKPYRMAFICLHTDLSVYAWNGISMDLPPSVCLGFGRWAAPCSPWDNLLI